ncbi:MAG: transporter substrate-binding protein [Tardiphaga sp.]|nr:transporter substrate-binding protein [Tardiphaga sp.]
MNRRKFLSSVAAASIAINLGHSAYAFEGAELYPGEKELFESARKEGLVVSFDTGPTWANWAGQFKAFQNGGGRRNIQAAAQLDGPEIAHRCVRAARTPCPHASYCLLAVHVPAQPSD